MSLQTRGVSAFRDYSEVCSPQRMLQEQTGGAKKEAEQANTLFPGAKRWFEVVAQEPLVQPAISVTGEKDWDQAIERADFERMRSLFAEGYIPSDWQFHQLLANRRGYRKGQAPEENNYRGAVEITRQNLPAEAVRWFLDAGREARSSHLQEAIASYCSLDVLFTLMNQGNITPTADHLWSGIVSCREPLVINILIRQGAPVQVGHLQDTLTHNHPLETIEFLVDALEMRGEVIPEVVLHDALLCCPAQVIRFLIRRGVAATDQETIDIALRQQRSTEVIQAVLSGGMRVRSSSVKLAQKYNHPQATLEALRDAKYQWHQECALGIKECWNKLFFG